MDRKIKEYEWKRNSWEREIDDEEKVIIIGKENWIKRKSEVEINVSEG
jgi:hypothetical protein